MPQPSPAPTTPFTDAAGKTHTLAEFKGKAVVVNLWATWCAPCVAGDADAGQAGRARRRASRWSSCRSASTRTEDRANAEAFIAKRPPLPFYTDPTYGIAYRAEAAGRGSADHAADRRFGHGPGPGRGRRGLVGTRRAATWSRRSKRPAERLRTAGRVAG